MCQSDKEVRSYCAVKSERKARADGAKKSDGRVLLIAPTYRGKPRATKVEVGRGGKNEKSYIYLFLILESFIHLFRIITRRTC